MEISTIAELFLKSVDNLPDHPAYFDKVDGEWVKTTYGEAGKIVENLAFGLASLGVKSSDKVAILSGNQSRWVLSDYAITGLGAATVTVYPTLISSQIKYIVENSDTKLIFVEDEEQTAKVMEFIDDLTELKTVVVMNDQTPDDKRLIGFSDLIKTGSDFKSKAGFTFKERALAVKPDDLLTLIYTSGTTGDPKGVMLSHKNLVSNIVNGRKAIKIDDTDVFLSFLPLSHSFERMVGHLTAFSANSKVYFAESIDTVADNMREVHPTVVVAVPRFFEKVHGKVIDKVSNDPAIRQKIFHWALGVGRKSAQYLTRGSKPTGFLGLKFGIADKLVFSKLKERVGGKLRFFVSGGAPLSKEIGEFFASANIPILEGYGLTETSPVITCNRTELYKFGTVGCTIDGVEVKIAEDGEILCKGDNVMLGYYKNPEATTKTIDNDGWFHTGDVGHLDDENYLVITDRIKNLIVTSGGKNIAPAQLENALVLSKYIEQCLAIGDQRNFVSALIVPAQENLTTWAETQGIPSEDYKTLLAHPQVTALFEAEVEKSMEGFARYETIKKFALLPDLWTISGSEITPSLKVKRKVVLEKYADQVEG
ncbi:MAG: long-chain fatty acid--CoA ligase, partial [Candidatus Marinimicrobia bacterium]|nr:long-chain fatty acid--CoA ligase [Candidatus Neomarinimicrobiota bacterium]